MIGMQVRYLDAEEVTAIHWELVEIFTKKGEPILPPGPRDEGLIKSAVTRPQTSSRGTDKYKTIEAKAAALFHSLVMNHAFHNGNKRTALVSLLVFLKRNKHTVDVTDQELFDFVIKVANNEFKNQTKRGTADEVVNLITCWIQAHCSNVDNEVRSMKTSEFISACEMAGARCVLKNGTWKLLGVKKQSSLSISNSTKQLGRMAVKRYLQKLGLVTPISGVFFTEFESGISPQQEMIRKFRNVLDQLAHA